MKYIIFDNKYPVIFPESITHCTVKLESKKPTSAGYLDISWNGSIKVFGESGTLNLKSKPEDRILIEKMINY
jgi:hypothetical protein